MCADAYYVDYRNRRWVIWGILMGLPECNSWKLLLERDSRCLPSEQCLLPTCQGCTPLIMLMNMKSSV